MGAAFPAQVKEAKVVLLSEKEKKDRGGADGHVLAISEYEPGSEYTYYWGSAWDKAAIKTPDAWNKYMTEYAQKLRTPLAVKEVRPIPPTTCLHCRLPTVIVMQLCCIVWIRTPTPGCRM